MYIQPEHAYKINTTFIGDNFEVPANTWVVVVQKIENYEDLYEVEYDKNRFAVSSHFLEVSDEPDVIPE